MHLLAQIALNWANIYPISSSMDRINFLNRKSLFCSVKDPTHSNPVVDHLCWPVAAGLHVLDSDSSWSVFQLVKEMRDKTTALWKKNADVYGSLVKLPTSKWNSLSPIIGSRVSLTETLSPGQSMGADSGLKMEESKTQNVVRGRLGLDSGKQAIYCRW